MKKQSDLSKLFDYAGKYKYLTMTSWVLSAVSALVALLPFVYIWRIIKEVLDVAPNYSEAQHLSYYGWMAVLFLSENRISLLKKMLIAQNLFHPFKVPSILLMF